MGDGSAPQLCCGHRVSPMISGEGVPGGAAEGTEGTQSLPDTADGRKVQAALLGKFQERPP